VRVLLAGYGVPVDPGQRTARQRDSTAGTLKRQGSDETVLQSLRSRPEMIAS
jgi:hypothetical protein